MAREKRKDLALDREFTETVIKVRRVSKVITGGRRFSFSAIVVVGDKKGKVGIALGKSREVASAIQKASKRARQNMIKVPLYKSTLPFTVQGKHGASKVILRSASKGTGVIAGGPIRALMEAAGVQDVLTKSLGSDNPGNVAKATMNALQKLASVREIARLRGKTPEEILGVANAQS